MAQDRGSPAEEVYMDRFLDNAARVFEGGAAAAQAGATQPDWTVLLTAHGGVRMVAGSDWPLESLAREAGAEMAYRVSVTGMRVHVEGVSGARRCALQGDPPAAVFRRLLSDRREYRLAAAPVQ